MERPVTSDIFKFMALRPPTTFDHERDLVTIIRDTRIQNTYLPDNAHMVSDDETTFSKSAVGQYVFTLVKEYLEEVFATTITCLTRRLRRRECQRDVFAKRENRPPMDR